jgi:hypothetical protein
VKNKIIARNLTARAAYNVPGNPPSTRLESGVGNCYPGLEYDHRNLDRRFFPGLVFEFVSQDDATSPEAARQGALLRNVDLIDSGLGAFPAGLEDVARTLLRQLQGDDGVALGAAGTHWYISAITQAGKTIQLERIENGQTTPLDGLLVWRLVRSLRPEETTLELRRRDDVNALAVTLQGWRRRFTDSDTGVISAAYEPGELTQSLCSPWMHDFRDCGCTYWASNHPDIVLAEAPLYEPTLPSGAPDQFQRGSMRVDWLRADHNWLATNAIGPRGDYNAQMSHFDINHRWQDLAIVLEGREIGNFYVPRSCLVDNARPYATPTELRDQLFTLAGLEHLVSLLYLYARYSVLSSLEASNAPGAQNLLLLGEDVDFARHILLEIAISEMQHLRWVNQILWHLFESSVVPDWAEFDPIVLRPAEMIPGAGGLPDMPAKLAPLTPETLQLFIDAEKPSGFIDGRYARVTATLLQPGYPPHLHDLASTIVRDGEQHYLHFRDVQQVLNAYSPDKYLRPIAAGAPEDPEVAAALQTYREITNGLFEGYQRGNLMNMKSIAEARAKMFVLDTQAEALASKNIGIPFLSLFAADN